VRVVVPVVVVVRGVLVAVGTALRVEACINVLYLCAQPGQHVTNDRIRPYAQVIGMDLGGKMPVADMPGQL